MGAVPTECQNGIMLRFTYLPGEPADHQRLHAHNCGERCSLVPVGDGRDICGREMAIDREGFHRVGLHDHPRYFRTQERKLFVCLETLQWVAAYNRQESGGTHRWCYRGS